MQTSQHRFCVAPMMDWTDRHCRFFHRLITRRAQLYTEMVTAEAILHGKRDQLLGFSGEEHPVALQLGGSDPGRLAAAARIGADYGYDEINLNVGCPSDRVQEGRFGACLMAEPDLVGDCVSAMRAAVSVPVTVKCRIGIDDQDSEADLERFATTMIAAGIEVLIVHARKAWLKGLSPKENREIPPLDYDRVYRLKARHPELMVVINGGIASLEEAEAHLPHVDGVMLGRAAYQTPYDVLADVDRRIYGEEGARRTRAEILERLMPYVAAHLARGGRVSNVTRHILGLYHGRPRGRHFRRHLSEHGTRAGAGVEVIADALALVEQGRSAASAEIAETPA
ncbi:MAG TPA: tRNA dihydrouridine(20/20a) synthase DusA [Hyphomicrobiaceae bacterium]|nr:tRNA dihydrouridine(20/20a) synthase DusA [Hyphomicrobiaceae bacterium]